MEKINSCCHSLNLKNKYLCSQKIILKTMEVMTQGKLNLFLPDGTLKVFGKDDKFEATLYIKNPLFFRKCLFYGDIGFGESFVEGHIESPDIVAVLKWFLLNVENATSISGSRKKKNIFVNFFGFLNRVSHVLRENNLMNSRRNIAEHYDLGNDFFNLFLDETKTYSSAYFEHSTTSLQEAQIKKYRKLCSAIHLKDTDHVLEIGSGWGGFALFMAETFGCQVTTITISQKQYDYVLNLIKEKKLQEKVTIKLCDYREIEGQFDKIVSVEMLEAVGAKYYSIFFEKCSHLLRPQGLMGLQVILCHDSRFESLKKNVDWIQKHIFPGSLLPSLTALTTAANKKSQFTLYYFDDMGIHYAHTLKTWRKTFLEKNKEVLNLGFSQTFFRKWDYYLAYCEAAFYMRNITVAQMVYTKPNNMLLNYS